MGLNWLITGGCGFIGTRLIARLWELDREHRIRVLDNLSTGTRDDLQQACNFIETEPEAAGGTVAAVELIVADIKDERVAVEASRGIDVIVHLAANTGVAPSVEDPRADCLTNVIGTLNYLEAARLNRVRRFVFASSGAPVGEVVPPIHEELPPHPVSPYGASKLAGEGYCSAYYRSFDLDTVALRFGNVFGPGSIHKNSVVAKFIRQALAGETIEIYGDGNQTRDFIYIDDLVEALILAAGAKNVGGEIFQIASSAETTVNELLQALLDVFRSRNLDLPRVCNADKRVGDVMRNFSDTSKAKQRLGWQSKTSLNEGLRQTVSYYLE